MAEQALAEALDHLVRGIVDHPERVRVDSRDTPRGEVLEVRVHPSDLGRVIGRGGRTASSLRTVISALAESGRVRVDVVDTDETDSDEVDGDAVDSDEVDGDEPEDNA